MWEHKESRPHTEPHFKDNNLCVSPTSLSPTVVEMHLGPLRARRHPHSPLCPGVGKTGALSWNKKKGEDTATLPSQANRNTEASSQGSKQHFPSSETVILFLFQARPT